MMMNKGNPVKLGVISFLCLVTIILFGCEFGTSLGEARFSVSSTHTAGDELLVISYNGGVVAHEGNRWSDSMDVDIGQTVFISASATFGTVYVSVSVRGDGSCSDYDDYSAGCSFRVVIEEVDEEE